MNDYKKERMIYAFALLLTTIALIFFWNQNTSQRGTIQQIAAERDQYKSSIDSLRNADRELLPVTRIKPLSQTEWRALVNRGLSEPLADIRKDLQENGHLIPFEGVLGGTPNFYNPDGIHLLNDRWVMAEFDDGHVMGYLLLEYSVERNGNIDWRIIEYFVQ